MPRTERDLSLTCRDDASAPSARKVQVLHQLSNGVAPVTRRLQNEPRLIALRLEPRPAGWTIPNPSEPHAVRPLRRRLAMAVSSRVIMASFDRDCDAFKPLM